MRSRSMRRTSSAIRAQIQKRVLAWKRRRHIGKSRKPTDGLKRPSPSSTRPVVRLHERSFARNSAATRTPPCIPRKGTASTSGAPRS